MLRWILIILFLGNISGCAAIQGAHGDVAMAQKTAAAQAASQNAEATNSQTNASSPGPSTTPSQHAGTNAAKMIAPLTH